MKDENDLKRPWRSADRVEALAAKGTLPAWLMLHELQRLWFQQPSSDAVSSGRLLLLTTAIRDRQISVHRETQDTYFARNGALPAGFVIHSSHFIWIHRDDFLSWIATHYDAWFDHLRDSHLRPWLPAKIGKREIQRLRKDACLDAIRAEEARIDRIMYWPERFTFLQKQPTLANVFSHYDALHDYGKGRLPNPPPGRPHKNTP